MVYFWSQRWLAEIPIWMSGGTLLILTTTSGVIYFIARHQNGFPFCLAISGAVGDLLLSIVMLIAFTVLQRYETLPVWATTWRYHAFIVFIAIITAIILVSTGKSGMGKFLDDYYHSVVIVPVFVYLLLAIALPAIFFAHSTKAEWWAAVILIAAYLLFVVIDIAMGNMDQREKATQIFVEHGYPRIIFPLDEEDGK